MKIKCTDFEIIFLAMKRKPRIKTVGDVPPQVQTDAHGAQISSSLDILLSHMS